VTNRSPGLTRNQLDSLLSGLDPDHARAALGLERLRTRLEIFFAANRGRWPDELADRAVDVLARRLSEGEAIECPEAYALGVARRLLLEDRRKQWQAPIPLNETHGVPDVAVESEDLPPTLRLECLKLCVGRVDGSDVFLEYHRGESPGQAAERQDLARRLHLSPGGLRKRVHKIRQSLEQCVRDCQRAGGVGTAAGRGAQE